MHCFSYNLNIANLVDDANAEMTEDTAEVKCINGKRSSLSLSLFNGHTSAIYETSISDPILVTSVLYR